MKIVVTGASGFIGGAVVDELLKRGHSVIAVSRDAKNAEDKGHPNISWIIGQLTNSTAVDINALKPDVVIHSAWIATPGIYLDSEENERLIGQSHRFLKQLEHGGVVRIVVVGTCYEKISGHSSKYVQAKQALHEMLEKTVSEAVSFCWARVFFPYGTGEHPEKLPSYLIETLFKGDVPIIKSPQTENDYIHIHDVASALALIAENGSTGIYEIGSGQRTSVLAIAKLIASALGKEELLDSYIMGDQKSQSCELSVVADLHALKSLRWEPEFTMAAGINELVISKLASERQW